MEQQKLQLRWCTSKRHSPIPLKEGEKCQICENIDRFIKLGNPQQEQRENV